MSEPTGMSVGTLAEATIAALTEVNATATLASIEWSRAGIPFAATDGETLEVRLAVPVAHAALRTPDTEPSRRGAEWVRFTPVVLDQYAADRATAWVESAWRNAGT